MDSVLWLGHTEVRELWVVHSNQVGGKIEPGLRKPGLRDLIKPGLRCRLKPGWRGKIEPGLRQRSEPGLKCFVCLDYFR